MPDVRIVGTIVSWLIYPVLAGIALAYVIAAAWIWVGEHIVIHVLPWGPLDNIGAYLRVVAAMAIGLWPFLLLAVVLWWRARRS